MIETGEILQTMRMIQEENFDIRTITLGINLLVALANGLIRAIPTLLAMIPQIITALINAFTNTDWSSIGHNIVSGIWGGIVGMWSDLTTKVSQAVENLWKSAKACVIMKVDICSVSQRKKAT